MEKYKIKINKLEILDDLLVILSTDNIKFVSPIIKGSVNFNIYNQFNDQLSLNNLEENNLVIIYGIPSKKNQTTIKNSIVINKIIIKNNYTFYSDTSEEISDYES